MRETGDTKFIVFTIICILSYADSTCIGTYRPSPKIVFFGFKRLQKRANTSKSLFRKFVPKTILSLPYMGKGK